MKGTISDSKLESAAMLANLSGAGSYTLKALKQDVAVLKAEGKSTIDVGMFKERFGVTRKFAIPLLEYLDRERVTRRVGESRLIL